MRIVHHGPNLVQLTRLGVINCWLVREDDGFTLIDTTSARGARAIARAIDSLQAPLRRIILTHDHLDHAGSLDALVARMSGDASVEVLASAREARIIAGNHQLEPGEEGKMRGLWTRCRTPLARELAHGDRVGSLEVVAAPGHTYGHVALIDTRDRTLLCGDAFTTVGGVASTGEFRWRFFLSWLGSCDRPQARATSRMLASLDVSRLAPGHGPLVAPALPALAAAVARIPD